MIFRFGKKKLLIFLGLVLISFTLFSQTIKRVEPPFWFTGMQDKNLQLMIYGDQLSDCEVKCDVRGLIKGITKTENSNYLFLDLIVPENLNNTTVRFDFYKDNKRNSSLNFNIKI